MTDATQTSTIKLDRERRLKFNVSSARRFKAIYGMPLYQVRLIRNGGVEVLDHDCLVAVLAVGLDHEDAKMGVDRVTRLLDNYLATRPAGGLQPILDAVKAAFKESGLFPGMEQEEDGEPGKAESQGSVAAAE